MDHYGQTRLLRVIQERVNMRLESDKYIPTTARVIAVTKACAAVPCTGKCAPWVCARP